MTISLGSLDLDHTMLMHPEFLFLILFILYIVSPGIRCRGLSDMLQLFASLLIFFC
jgi:hypothetical protein